MKFCLLLCFVIIVPIINSCVAERDLKTESSPSNAGENSNESHIHNDTVKDEQLHEPSLQTSPNVESLPPESVKNSPAAITENVGQASQIQSSFEDVPKSQVTVDDVAVNDNLPGVLNQGTLSQELPDAGTLGIISLVDSATADLQQRASSASADVQTDSVKEKASASNNTEKSPPPIVILPPSSVEQIQPKDDEGKTDSMPTTTEKPREPDPPQPPVVRAEPKVVDPTSETAEVKLDLDARSKEPSIPHSSESSLKQPEPVPIPTSQSGSTLDLVGTPTADVPLEEIPSTPTADVPHEEIPSFSEWTQKQLEEAEKKKGQNKTSTPPPSRGPIPSKLRSKNYGSPDCGAKIVATNPEAENPNGVLSNSKDEYLINKCSTQRMWLIIELCEAIQAKKIELANFELFSSSPKDFSVSLSHNYPSREWSSVGQFTAKDERTVQSFNLNPHLFGKFLKVEFNSHYGKEHFCCTSLIRVYGTSEFEVLETENEGHGAVSELDEEDEDELPIGADIGKPAKNLFGHATDAVYTIVRKAAEVLVKSGGGQNQSQIIEPKNTTALIPSHRMQLHHCSTLRHLVVCNNCSEEFYDQVYHLLSCQSSDLQALIESPFVFDGINNSQLCSFYGLDFLSKRNSILPLRLRNEDQLDQAGYLAAMLPAEYISALCNILAVLEGKVVLNNSQAANPGKALNLNDKLPKDTRDSNFKNLLIEHQAPQTCSVNMPFTSSHCKSTLSDSETIQNVDASISPPGSQYGSSTISSIASEIRPTRTLTREDRVDDSIPSSEAISIQAPSQKPSPEVTATMVDPNIASVQPSSGPASSDNSESASSDKSKIGSSVPVTSPETFSPDQSSLEAPSSDREKDMGDPSYALDSGTSEDQEPSKDLDALFMEMKALDNSEESPTEPNPSIGGSSSTPSSVVTQTRIPTQQAQKESVFLRLSNKIKALERNMSLSGQYLEELSRRYKKQEELSRALNKTLGLLRDEVRKSKDRELQRDNDLHFLRTQIIQLTATVELFQSERDSWQHKAVVISQHCVLIVIEVVMFGVVVWMCRRLPNDSSAVSSGGPQRKWSSSWRRVHKPNVKQHQHLRRRSSLNNLGSSSDLRKRRPSEEALQITGSYKDLLLNEENVVVVEGEDITSQGNDPNSWLAVSSSRDQRRRRRRKKEALMKSSSSENLSQLKVDHSQSTARKISAPLHSYSLPVEDFDNCNVNVQNRPPVALRQSSLPASGRDLDASVSEAALTPSSDLYNAENGIVGTQVYTQIPTTYMETATSARNRRSIILLDGQLPFQDWKCSLEGESGSSVSGQSSRSKGLDSLEPVQTSNQSNNQSGIIEEKKKKPNRKGGLKNMVKKFF